MVTNVKINDEYYSGSGNGRFGVFAKVKILKIYDKSVSPHFGVEIIDNIYSMWESGMPGNGAQTKVFATDLFDSYEDAEKNFFKDMNFKDRNDIIKHVFTKYRG